MEERAKTESEATLAWGAWGPPRVTLWPWCAVSQDSTADKHSLYPPPLGEKRKCAPRLLALWSAQGAAGAKASS